MIIDCDDCVMRDLACADCVVTVLLGGSPAAVGPVEFDAAEQRAVASLAGAGLVPPLRMRRRATGLTESA